MQAITVHWGQNTNANAALPTAPDVLDGFLYFSLRVFDRLARVLRFREGKRLSSGNRGNPSKTRERGGGGLGSKRGQQGQVFRG